VTDPIDDVRATADDLAADADRLKAIEQRKATLDADDPTLVELSDEAERLTEDMAAKARIQSQLVDEATAGSDA
jgi:hypothetical protein